MGVGSFSAAATPPRRATRFNVEQSCNRMAKRKRRARRTSAPEPPPAESIIYSDLSLHQLFEQQTRQMLERSDLDEEQKQSILVAMNCPCCGAGAMSYTVKLKR